MAEFIFLRHFTVILVVRLVRCSPYRILHKLYRYSIYLGELGASLTLGKELIKSEESVGSQCIDYHVSEQSDHVTRHVVVVVVVVVPFGVFLLKKYRSHLWRQY